MFNGVTVEGPSLFGASGVTLRAGESITATVSPARSEDKIFLSGSAGLHIILAEGPTSGFHLRPAGHVGLQLDVVVQDFDDCANRFDLDLHSRLFEHIGRLDPGPPSDDEAREGWQGRPARAGASTLTQHGKCPAQRSC